MGSDAGLGDERPVHTVTLDAFWIDKTEVTNAMYALCVKAGNCPALSQRSSERNQIYFGNPQFDNYPAINVSWDNANAYCKWAIVNCLPKHNGRRRHEAAMDALTPGAILRLIKTD